MSFGACEARVSAYSKSFMIENYNQKHPTSDQTSANTRPVQIVYVY
jgi:hypothetical protein